MTTNTNAALTRDQWIDACAQRYMTEGALPQESAVYFAGVCADQQTELNGADIAEWDSPNDAADEDMSYWENDE